MKKKQNSGGNKPPVQATQKRTQTANIPETIVHGDENSPAASEPTSKYNIQKYLINIYSSLNSKYLDKRNL